MQHSGRDEDGGTSIGASDFSDNELLQRLVTVGLARLPPDRLTELAAYLEARAVDTGLAAPVFVAQAIRAIGSCTSEHNERGGVRIAFLAKIDSILRSHLQEIQKGDPLQATARARQLRDEVVEWTSSYDPTNTYEE